MDMLWIFVTFVIGILIIGFTYMQTKDHNNVDLKKRLLTYLAPTLVLIAVVELIIVPNFGSSAVASLYPLFIICWVLPVTTYTNRKKR